MKSSETNDARYFASPMVDDSTDSLLERVQRLDQMLPLYSNQHDPQVWKLRQLVPELAERLKAAEDKLSDAEATISDLCKMVEEGIPPSHWKRSNRNE